MENLLKQIFLPIFQFTFRLYKAGFKNTFTVMSLVTGDKTSGVRRQCCQRVPGQRQKGVDSRCQENTHTRFITFNHRERKLIVEIIIGMR